MSTSKKIKVLVVDDSLMFRELIVRGISADSQIEVVATAVDPFDARDKILECHPDVMTCDIEMPKMNGIEFIRRLLPQYPLPVIVISTISGAVFDALNAGAVEFLSKPEMSSPQNVNNFIEDLLIKIRIAARSKIGRRRIEAAVQKNEQQKQPQQKTTPHKTVSQKNSPQKSAQQKPDLQKITTGEAVVEPASRRNDFAGKIITIGSSTGGTEALYYLLKNLPPNMPPIAIVQHIPPVFSRLFAERLNAQTAFSVKEAETGDLLEPGKVVVAPGNYHLRIQKRGKRYVAIVEAGEKVNGHCPSVDVLFESAAHEAGEDAFAIILTGMGYDGAKGMLQMRKKGARTIGQDEQSCVVYGMPKIAYEIGAVEIQAPLTKIPETLLSMLNR